MLRTPVNVIHQSMSYPPPQKPDVPRDWVTLSQPPGPRSAAIPVGPIREDPGRPPGSNSGINSLSPGGYKRPATAAAALTQSLQPLAGSQPVRSPVGAGSVRGLSRHAGKWSRHGGWTVLADVHITPSPVPKRPSPVPPNGLSCRIRPPTAQQSTPSHTRHT